MLSGTIINFDVKMRFILMIFKNNGENIWNCPKNVVSLHRK
jgi:hypothetical protein